MDTEKKPKRPRIGASSPINEGAEGEARYEKVNYPGDSANYNAERAQRPNYGNYQPRQQYNGYNNRQGGYNRYNNNYGQQGYQQQGYKRQAIDNNADENAENKSVQGQENNYQPRQN